MNCPLQLASYAHDCAPNIGGVKRVWAADLASLAVSEFILGYTECSVSVDPAIGATNPVFKLIAARPALSSLTSTPTFNEDNDTLYHHTELNLVLNRLDVSRQGLLYSLPKSTFVVAVEDMNGDKWLLGIEPGDGTFRRVQLTGGTVGTGTQKGDRNGYELTLACDTAGPVPALYAEDEMFETS